MVSSPLNIDPDTELTNYFNLPLYFLKKKKKGEEEEEVEKEGTARKGKTEEERRAWTSIFASRKGDHRSPVGLSSGDGEVK